MIELFIETHTYNVPENRIDRYLDIQRGVRKIYFRYGFLGYEVFKGADDHWLEINKYKDKEHYEDVNNSVDLDPEIEVLWNEFCLIVEKEKIITRKYYQAL